MNQTASSVHTDVALHPKMPFIARFCLMQLRITGFLCVLCGAGSVDDCCIYDGSALHHMPSLYHDTVYGVEKQLVQFVFLQKMAELAQRRFIRNCFGHEVDLRKFPHGVAVIDCILCCRVR